MFAWLRRFTRHQHDQQLPFMPNTLDAVPLSDLKRPLRARIIAERQAATTAALHLAIERGTISPLPPRKVVVAGVRVSNQTRGASQ